MRHPLPNDRFINVKHDLLTHEEEIELSRAVHAGYAARALEVHTALIDGVIANGVAARNKLVESNLRLVISCAKKHKYDGDMTDLTQEGALGLIRAAEKYQGELGYRFSTYATFWIHQKIGRYIARMGVTRVPEDVTAMLRNGDTDDPRVIAANSIQYATRLDAMSSDDRDVYDLLADDTTDFTLAIESAEMRAVIADALGSLPEDCAEYVRMRFGFEGEPMTFTRIGAAVGRSGEHVRQRVNIGLHMLKSKIVLDNE